MNAEQKRRAREIFADAIGKDDPQDRAALVAQACGTDAELRQLVEDLLKAHEGADDLPGQTMLAASGQVIGERPGTVISHYKLLQEIGEGGFGIVFMAEQLEPVQRKVALKIIKAGMDTKEVIARFEAERQALALMDHPNIARVLDAGATESGRPYFVMELVKGIPITDYCEQQDLPVEDRLQLFIKVCHAVQHAHQKGIIHRDLKPSNVMITLHDGEAVPKVIDFGIAKATGQRLTDKTLFTRYEQMIGTPAYMSPEQAAMSGLDVDTRTDIYALGVLLYELLTGVTPYDKETLARAAFDEIRRMICETEPPKPSTRLSEMSRGQILEGSGAGSVVRGQRLKAVRGDLDWIAMKALEKDRRRRYETANALADDIQRHVEHQPIQARPPSAAYRTRKFVRRHRTGVALAMAVSCALLIGLAAALIGFTQAKQARDQALVAESVAREEAAIAEAVKQFLRQDLLVNADPWREADPDVKLRTLVDRAAANVETRFQDRPLVEAEIRTTLSEVYGGLGDYTHARTHLDRALQIYEARLPNDAPRLLNAQHLSAWLLREEGHYRESESLLNQLLPVYRRVFGAEDAKTVHVMSSLVRTCEALGKHAEAQRLVTEVLRIRRRVLGSEHPQTLGSLSDHAIIHIALGNLAEAARIFEELIPLSERIRGPEALGTLVDKANLAVVYQRQGRFAEAQKLEEELLRTYQQVVGPEHSRTLVLMYNLSKIHSKQGKLTEAQRLAEEVFSARRRTLGPEHPHTIESIDHLAAIYQDQGKLAEALRLREEALSAAQRVLEPEHPIRRRVAINLSSTYDRVGKWAEAEKLLEEVLPTFREVLGPEHEDTLLAMNNLAVMYGHQGNRPDERKLYEEVLAIRRRILGSEHPDTLKTMGRLANAYSSDLKFTQANEIFEELLATRRRVLGSTHPDTLQTMNDFAFMLTLWNRGESGQRAVGLAEQAVTASDRTNAMYLGTLASALAAVGEFDQAVSVQRQAVARLSSEEDADWLVHARQRLAEFEKLATQAASETPSR